jgi:hypothetical protein
MKKSTKYILVGTAFFLLGLHFSLSALYAFRRHYDIPMVESVANKYGFPFFHQGYSLFVPMAEFDDFIEVRYREGGKWTEFQEIGSRYEYAVDSKLRQFEEFTSANLNNQILNNLYWKDGVRQLERIEQSTDYGRAVYFCQRLERAKRKLTHSHTYIDSMQVRLVYHFHPLHGEQKEDVFEFSKVLVEIDK